MVHDAVEGQLDILANSTARNFEDRGCGVQFRAK